MFPYAALMRQSHFGSRSENISRRIAQMEADLTQLQQESDTLTGRVFPCPMQQLQRRLKTIYLVVVIWLTGDLNFLLGFPERFMAEDLARVRALHKMTKARIPESVRIA